MSPKPVIPVDSLMPSGAPICDSCGWEIQDVFFEEENYDGTKMTVCGPCHWQMTGQCVTCGRSDDHDC